MSFCCRPAPSVEHGDQVKVWNAESFCWPSDEEDLEAE